MIARLLASPAADDSAEPLPCAAVASASQLPDAPVAPHRRGKPPAVPIALSDWLPQPAASDHPGRRDGPDAGRVRGFGADQRVRAQDALCGESRVPMCGRAESERARIGKRALRKGVVPRCVDSSHQHGVHEDGERGIDGRGG